MTYESIKGQHDRQWGKRIAAQIRMLKAMNAGHYNRSCAHSWKSRKHFAKLGRIIEKIARL